MFDTRIPPGDFTEKLFSVCLGVPVYLVCTRVTLHKWLFGVINLFVIWRKQDTGRVLKWLRSNQLTICFFFVEKLKLHKTFELFTFASTPVCLLNFVYIFCVLLLIIKHVIVTTNFVLNFIVSLLHITEYLFNINLTILYLNYYN